MDKENICPECGSHHHQDFVRCPSCHAYIVESSPWNGDFNLLAIPFSVLLWWGLDRVLLLQQMPTHKLVDDPISRAIIGIAIYGFIVLIFKWRVISRQVRAFRQIGRVCAQFPSTLDEDVLTAARDAIAEARLGAYNQFVAFHRLRWLVSASKVDREDRAGLLEALRQHSESDWDSMESSFSFTQYLIWLLPSAGFLGTVWGMTQALKSFSTTVGSQSDLNFTAGLMDTAQGLGTAFHTTLVGLAAVIPLLAFATMLRRRSQNFLERTDKFFLRVAAQVLYHQQEPIPIPAPMSFASASTAPETPPIIIPEFPAREEPEPEPEAGEPEPVVAKAPPFTVRPVSPDVPPPVIAPEPVETEPAPVIAPVPVDVEPVPAAETVAPEEAPAEMPPDVTAEEQSDEEEPEERTEERETTAPNLEIWKKRDRDNLTSEGIY